MAENDTLKFLRKEVKRTKVEPGTVVTFDRTIHTAWNAMRQEAMPLPEDETKVITYAAIFVGNRWFFTGKGQLGNERMTTRDFLERMGEEDISNIRVATGFELISDDGEDWGAI